jgi:FixJ family two-component response regulator
MGEMNGLDVQAQIAELSPGTRVIVITGREDSKMEAAVRGAGAIAYFSKPFDDGQFLGAVRAALAMQLHPRK